MINAGGTAGGNRPPPLCLATPLAKVGGGGSVGHAGQAQVHPAASVTSQCERRKYLSKHPPRRVCLVTENGGRASMWPNLDLTRRVANDASGVVAGVCQQGCAVYQVVQSSRRLFSTNYVKLSIHEALPHWAVHR